MAVAATPMSVSEPSDLPSDRLEAERDPVWVVWVEAARQGDTSAFSRLHRDFGAMVHGLLLARVDPASADDLTQEVFLRAWQRLDRLHEPRAWPSWLATIARRRALDHVRAARRPGTLPLESELAESELAGAMPDAAVRTEAERLLARIRELSDAHAEPLILRLVEGLSGPEIAERTGLSPAYVRVNLHRGMKLLRERLETERGQSR